MEACRFATVDPNPIFATDMPLECPGTLRGKVLV